MDQFFGRIAQALSATDGKKIITIVQLLTTLRQSYQTGESDGAGVHAEVINSVANTADWVTLTKVDTEFKGITKPHVFQISRIETTKIDTLNRSYKVTQTILKTKFLSDSDEDDTNIPHVLLEGEPIILSDPVAVPPIPLEYELMTDTANRFYKCGEFSRDDRASWMSFIDKHRNMIGHKCPECNQIRIEQSKIGKIRNGVTEKEKKEKQEKKKLKDDLKKRLTIHLRSTLTEHEKINGWWINALPKAGEDVPYNYTNEIIETKAQELNQQFEASQRVEEPMNEMKWSEFKCDETGHLIEPVGQLLIPSKGTHIDIRSEMADKVSQH